MKKFMLVQMIALCIGIGGKTKKSVISVVLHDRERRKEIVA